MSSKKSGLFSSVTKPFSGITSNVLHHSTKSPANEPASTEVTMPVRLPLIEAIKAMGGSQVLLAATELDLVITKFPRGTLENRYITGLQGRVSTSISEKVSNPTTNQTSTIKMSKGDLFRIRWDFDPGNPGGATTAPVNGKGVHVNAEFFGSGPGCATTKIAFTPTPASAAYDIPTNRNSTLFEQVVRDQSHFVEYDTKVNSPTHVFSPEERTTVVFKQRVNQQSLNGEELRSGEQVLEAQRESLREMARRLARRWAGMVDCVGENRGYAVEGRDMWLASGSYGFLSS